MASLGIVEMLTPSGSAKSTTKLIVNFLVSAGSVSSVMAILKHLAGSVGSSLTVAKLPPLETSWMLFSVN